MSWEDQGRQGHGWFGHGSAPETSASAQQDNSAAALFDPTNAADRFDAIAHAAIANLPAADRGRASASFDARRLVQFRTLMSALSERNFPGASSDMSANSDAVDTLRQAAELANKATSQQDLAQASSLVAQAMQTVGLDSWSRFLAGAASNADANGQSGKKIQFAELQTPNQATDAIRDSGNDAQHDLKKAEFQAKFDAAVADAYKKWSLDCSHYLQAFLKNMGFADTPYRTANEFMAFVQQKDSGWVKVTEEEAVRQSANGRIAIAGLADTSTSTSQGHVAVVGQKMMSPSTTTRISQSPQVFGGGVAVPGWSANRSTGQNTVADAWQSDQVRQVTYWVKQ